MQKPKSVVTGVRSLVAAVVFYTFGMLSFTPWSDLSMVLIVCVVIISAFYATYLLWKGRFWVRSVMLAALLLNVISLNWLSAMLSAISVSFSLLIAFCLQIVGVIYLYKKDSNDWFSELLVQDAQKKLAARDTMGKLKDSQ